LNTTSVRASPLHAELDLDLVRLVGGDHRDARDLGGHVPEVELVELHLRDPGRPIVI